MDAGVNGWCRCRAKTSAALCQRNILPVKSISQRVNTDKSYYLRLCLLKVMSPNEQDTAIRLGVRSCSHYL